MPAAEKYKGNAEARTLYMDSFGDGFQKGCHADKVEFMEFNLIYTNANPQLQSAGIDGFLDGTHAAWKVRAQYEAKTNVAGFSERAHGGQAIEEMIPSGIMEYNSVSVRQALDVCAKLANAKLNAPEDLFQMAKPIHLKGAYPAMTRSQALAMLEIALHDQAGVIETQRDAKQITFGMIP